MTKREAKKHAFDLTIKSKDGRITLAFDAITKKWVAKTGDKVLGRRRNIAVLVDFVNGVNQVGGDA